MGIFDVILQRESDAKLSVVKVVPKDLFKSLEDTREASIKKFEVNKEQEKEKTFSIDLITDEVCSEIAKLILKKAERDGIKVHVDNRSQEEVMRVATNLASEYEGYKVYDVHIDEHYTLEGASNYFITYKYKLDKDDDYHFDGNIRLLHITDSFLFASNVINNSDPFGYKISNKYFTLNQFGTTLMDMAYNALELKQDMGRSVKEYSDEVDLLLDRLRRSEKIITAMAKLCLSLDLVDDEIEDIGIIEFSYERINTFKVYLSIDDYDSVTNAGLAF